MKASEAKRLAEQHGCKLKPYGHGVWRIERTPDNYGLITKAELNRTNQAKFVSFYVPEERD